jgi:polyhydroxyalkanoate synthase
MTDSSGPGKRGQEPGNPDIHIPDPVQLARDFAEIAERSQRLVLEFLQRQQSDGVDMASPFSLGQA